MKSLLFSRPTETFRKPIILFVFQCMTITMLFAQAPSKAMPLENHQTSAPGLLGNEGFKTKADAEKIALL